MARQLSIPIDQLTSRELDKAVHEDVMGQPLCMCGNPECDLTSHDDYGKVPAYSQDPGLAWQVIEKLRAQGVLFYLHHWPHATHAEFSQANPDPEAPDDERWLRHTATTDPLHPAVAICRAALKAAKNLPTPDADA